MKFLTVTLFFLALLGGCSTGSTGSSGAVAVEALPVKASSGEEEKYRIGPGDVLNISVWGNPDLTLGVPVRPDGYISMPLVGDIKADGIDPASLAGNITNSLQAHLRNPQVTVVVSQINSAVYISRVRVTGAVNNPVSIPHAKGMSVLDLILEAGGLSDVAAGNKTKLYRVVDDKLLEVTVNLDDILLRGRLDTNYPLEPGDVLTVPERLF